MEKKKGFDLGELLKDVSELDTGREQIEYIHLDLIDSDPNNFYQLSNIEQLADNISMCGLQQPIRVRPVPGGSGRYIIVSGHRRRAAVELLAKEDPERWAEVPCIVETDAVSPSLQQLRLIYANANTRTMTPAEISEQAVQVEKLLYQLKEEGYDFPGRMRDYVAQAVGASKTKLARLKVIRKNLAACWVDVYKEGTLTESQAYALAQMPKSWQSLIHENYGYGVKTLYADVITRYRDRFQKITKIQCQHGFALCEHSVAMMERSCFVSNHDPCDRCCFECYNLQTCKNVCPEAKAKQKEMKAIAKKASFDAKREQEERDRPGTEFAKLVWQRIGLARKASGVSVKEVVLARGESFYNATCDDPKQEKQENGEGHYSPSELVSFGYGNTAADMMKVVAVADALKCSVDYLLGRSEDMRPVAGWQTGDPWNFGEYVVLVRYDSARSPTPEKMTWTEEGWEMLGTAFEEVFSDAAILGWMPMPEEDDDLTPAIDVIRETGVASVSMLQRKLKIGYAAASELMDKLEKAGIVGPYSGSQPREILIDTEVAEK